MRLLRTVAAVLTMALLLASVAAAQSPPRRPVGDHAGPAALDSPAWRELMAEPLHRAQTMSYHAAAVAAGWRRQVEASALRDHLLALHAKALLSGLPEGRLGDLMARPPADRAGLEAAWDAGLNHAWADVRWDPGAPLGGLPEGMVPWPARAGIWRSRDGGVAIHAAMANRSPIVIALPGTLYLDLRQGDITVSLACTPVGISGRWLPNESARFWCASAGALPNAAWPALAGAVPRWRSNLPADSAALGEWIDRLAGPQPQSVAELVERHAHCRDQMNCRQGGMSTTEQLARARALAEAREPAERERMQRERSRAGSVQSLYFLGSLVAGFAIYALVARVTGTTLASGLIIGLSVLVATWVFGEARSSSGWAALSLLMIAAGALAYGVLLSLVYRWLYRRFLAPG